jgi:hypothetical protein
MGHHYPQAASFDNARRRLLGLRDSSLAMPTGMPRRGAAGKGVRLVTLLRSPPRPCVRSTSISNPCVSRGRTSCPNLSPAGERAFDRVFEVMRAVAWREALVGSPAARAPLAACSS